MSSENHKEITNENISEELFLIGSYYTMVADTYRSKTYMNAANTISTYNTQIISGTQAKKIKGIGDSVAKDIDEFIVFGFINRLQELEIKLGPQKQIIDYFRSFFGIGPKTAIKFYNEGYRTLEDLWFRASLTEAQKIGILWRHHIGHKIDRDEIDITHNIISQIFAPYQIIWDIAGSYRRREPQSGDIDILIQSRNDITMDAIIHLLQPLIPATLAKGDTKFMGIIRLNDDYVGHRIDIRIVNSEEYPFALMYFTGSQKFNILCRRRAIELGLTLNEYGLFTQDDRRVIATSEADIFTILNIPYVAPENRSRTMEYLPTQ